MMDGANILKNPAFGKPVMRKKVAQPGGAQRGRSLPLRKQGDRLRSLHRYDRAPTKDQLKWSFTRESVRIFLPLPGAWMNKPFPA